MKTVLLALLVIFAVATDARQLRPRSCSRGPEYWCGSPEAAVKCGAIEFCRQLRSRQMSSRVSIASAPAIQASSKLVRAAVQSDDCTTCQQVLDSVRQAVTQNQTQAQIAQALKSRLCGQGPQSDACSEVTDLMIGELVRMIAMNVKLQQLCTLLELCNQTSPTVAVKSAAHASPVAVKSAAHASRPVAVKSAAATKIYQNHPVQLLMQLQAAAPGNKPLSNVAGGSHMLCQALVFRARAGAKLKGESGDAGVAVMRAACQLASDRANREKCDSSLQANAPLIRHLLSSSLKPDTICHVLGAPASRSLPTGGPADCLVCRQAIREVARRTPPANQLSLQSVRAALPAACASLPYQHQRPQCRRLAGESSEEITRLMLQGFGPRLVCSKLGRCSSSHSHSHSHSSSSSSSSSSSNHSRSSLAFEASPVQQPPIVKSPWRRNYMKGVPDVL